MDITHQLPLHPKTGRPRRPECCSCSCVEPNRLIGRPKRCYQYDKRLWPPPARAPHQFVGDILGCHGNHHIHSHKNHKICSNKCANIITEIGFAEFVANVEWNQDDERLSTGSPLCLSFIESTASFFLLWYRWSAGSAGDEQNWWLDKCRKITGEKNLFIPTKKWCIFWEERFFFVFRYSGWGGGRSCCAQTEMIRSVHN